jgi:hypothetical protein
MHKQVGYTDFLSEIIFIFCCITLTFLTIALQPFPHRSHQPLRPPHHAFLPFRQSHQPPRHWLLQEFGLMSFLQ